MLCRECLEEQVENKCNSFLSFVQAEEEALHATAKSMPFHSRVNREIWLEENRKDKKEAMSRYKSNCVSAKIGWLDDCQSYPMNIVSVNIVSGIAATLVATFSNGHTISIQPKKSETASLGFHCRNDCSPIMYELNNQLVTGVQSYGGGEIHGATLVASLGLPHGYNVSDTFKYVEDHVGEVDCSVSEQIQLEALYEEIDFTIRNEGDKCQTTDGKTLLTVSYEIGWTKRSSGNKYDSKSGHAHILG